MLGNIFTVPSEEQRGQHPNVMEIDITAVASKASSCSSFGPGLAALFTVPAGQRLVIQFFSTEVFGPMPSRFLVSAVDPGNPGTAFFDHFVPAPSQGIAVAQPVRLYVEPGQALGIGAAGGGEGNCCFVSITGYLIDIQ